MGLCSSMLLTSYKVSARVRHGLQAVTSGGDASWVERAAGLAYGARMDCGVRACRRAWARRQRLLSETSSRSSIRPRRTACG